MSYRPHGAPQPLLLGYDPFRDLPADHLARLVDRVVDEVVVVPPPSKYTGQPGYNPKVCIKVLIYGYATGVRSSRQLEQLCREHLAYLFLTRGEGPGYWTLCQTRREKGEQLEAAWVGLFAVAKELGIEQLGRVVVDSSKLRANASSESVVKASQYEAMRAEVQRVLAEAEEVDRREGAQGPRERTRTGQADGGIQMRDILRRVRRALARGRAAGDGAAAERDRITPEMRQRLEAADQALKEAAERERKFVSLTDPDAEMMIGGIEKQIRECHSFEIAADAGSEMLMAAGVTQIGNDNERLEGLVAASAAKEPAGVKAVDADSGYFQSGPIARLNLAGIDTCIPDCNTAGDLHRGLPIGTTGNRSQVRLVYDKETDSYRCPDGAVLKFTQERMEGGQKVRIYVAECDCRGCQRCEECLRQKKAQHRTLKVGEHAELLAGVRQRFADPAHQERYRHRAEVVETVFGFLRGTLGYHRWLLRGAAGVEAEGRLFKLAYQVRKVHRKWSAAIATAQ